MKTNTLKRENPKHGNAQGFKFVTSKVFYRYYAMNISTSNSLKQELLLTDRVDLVAKEFAVSQHAFTQKPIKKQLINHVSLKSIFSLVDSHRNTIARDLSFEQAKPLSEHIQGSVIKFQAMVRMEVLS